MYPDMHTINVDNDLTMSQTTAFSVTENESMKEHVVHASTTRRTNCTSHQESKTRTHIRRRIQLACTRCRRRKIKCSGESSDGTTCTNCKAANNVDCQFLRPETTQLVPAPGSALAWHPPNMIQLAPSANSDSSVGRMHQHAFAFRVAPPHNAPYARSHSLSDLGQYNRVESLNRGSLPTNGFIDDIYNASYNPQTPPWVAMPSAASALNEFYGSWACGRSWNHASAAAAAIVPDMARSQSAIFYAAEVPAFCPTANTLSHSDMPAHRVLPVPTSNGTSPVTGNVTSSYLRDIDTASVGLSFMAGEDSQHIYPTDSKFLSSVRSTSATSGPFLNTFDTASIATQDDKPVVLGSHQQYLTSCTAISEDSFDTHPTTSSVFVRSSTSDSSDAEDLLMISPNGMKCCFDDGEGSKDNTSFLYG